MHRHVLYLDGFFRLDINFVCGRKKNTTTFLYAGELMALAITWLPIGL